MHVERMDKREQSSEDVNLSYVTLQCGLEENLTCQPLTCGSFSS